MAQAPNNAVYLTGDAAPLTTIIYDAQVEYQHPSTFFITKKKPGLIVDCKIECEQDLYNTLKYEIVKSTLKVKDAIAYLYYYANTELTGTLTADWTSFEVEIAKAGPVKPTDLVEATRTDTQLAANMMQPDPGMSKKFVAMYLLCLYRVARIINENYRLKIIEALDNRMIQVAKAEGSDFRPPTFGAIIYEHWLQDGNFLKVIDMYDIFFDKFPEHVDSILRVGTITSRFRDCATFGSIHKEIYFCAYADDFHLIIKQKKGKNVNNDLALSFQDTQEWCYLSLNKCKHLYILRKINCYYTINCNNSLIQEDSTNYLRQKLQIKVLKKRIV